MEESQIINTVIADKYRVSARIGGGAFGDVYAGTAEDEKCKVAIKFERRDHAHPVLRHEYKIYRDLQGCAQIPKAYYFGDYMDVYHVMVMDLMGPSIEDLFEKCGRTFSLKTVLRLADQLLLSISSMHEKCLIHRDVKPENFVVGIEEKCNDIYLLDFGLSKLYRVKESMIHLPIREGGLVGTPVFASINNHRKIAQSRRDDLESIAYMLIYFLKGSLPWQGIANEIDDKETKYKIILDCKQNTPISKLCDGLPVEFSEFLKYTRKMRFEEDPNIAYARKLFKDLYVKMGYNTETVESWEWDQGRTL